MKLIIIRHGDPDYSIDSLTPTGWREAELLSHRISKMDVKQFYVSPLGRAKDTAKPTLEKMGREATVLDWLREFPVVMHEKNGRVKDTVVWDWLPELWTAEPDFYDKDKWYNVPCFSEIGVPAEYKKVTDGLDALLEEHGYRRSGNMYEAVSPNKDTVVFFCHFGLECVLLSHLLGVSPMILWHGACAAPTSVTVLNTEERREGKAYFRMATFGDTSHLYAVGEEPSFAARFCETYADADQRHD